MLDHCVAGERDLEGLESDLEPLKGTAMGDGRASELFQEGHPVLRGRRSSLHPYSHSTPSFLSIEQSGDGQPAELAIRSVC